MNAGKTMNCPECGNTVAETNQFCSKCFARLEPPGFWRKLFLYLFQPVTRRGVNIHKIITLNTTKIVTQRDGVRHEYHSLDEMPPDERARYEQIQSESPKVTGDHVFKIKDLSGNWRSYQSLDEMPPDIRALVERAQKQINPEK